MAQRVVTTLISDLSGKELGDEGQTVSFGFEGVEYEMDLSSKEAEQLSNTFSKYISSARRVGGRRRPGTGVSRTVSPPGYNKKVREWANANGHKVSSRGRIPQEVIDAYEQAVK